MEHAEKRGCKGLFITVDAPQLGRREKDMRSKFSDVGSNVQSTGGNDVDRSQVSPLRRHMCRSRY